LVDANTATPSFVSDASGAYVVALVVADEGGLTSPLDEVEISSSNLPPTVEAGDDLLVVLGLGGTATVQLDGSASSDPDFDPLLYSWSLVIPSGSGSASALSDPYIANPTFLADSEGVYTATLNVTDFIDPGTPDSVEITATSAESFAEVQIVSTNDTVTALSATEVTTEGNQNALQNFLSQAIVALQPPVDVAEAINKLEKAIARTDGCVLRGAPDDKGKGRDWTTNCDAQTDTYNLLKDALNALLSP
jgi:hypothetical protein